MHCCVSAGSAHTDAERCRLEESRLAVCGRPLVAGRRGCRTQIYYVVNLQGHACGCSRCVVVGSCRLLLAAC